MKGIVYILEDIETGRFYIGSTSNLPRRMGQHQRGHTRTTKSMRSFRLIFSQEFATLQTARRIEKKIKSWKRKDFIIKIVSDGIIKVR